MLVLNGRKGDELILGAVKVHVLGYRNGSVRLGIDAPEDVPVSKKPHGSDDGTPALAVQGESKE